jgi:hypothetical protein
VKSFQVVAELAGSEAVVLSSEEPAQAAAENLEHCEDGGRGALADATQVEPVGEGVAAPGVMVGVGQTGAQWPHAATEPIPQGKLSSAEASNYLLLVLDNLHARCCDCCVCIISWFF